MGLKGLSSWTSFLWLKKDRRFCSKTRNRAFDLATKPNDVFRGRIGRNTRAIRLWLDRFCSGHLPDIFKVCFYQNHAPVPLKDQRA